MLKNLLTVAPTRRILILLSSLLLAHGVAVAQEVHEGYCTLLSNARELIQSDIHQLTMPGFNMMRENLKQRYESDSGKQYWASCVIKPLGSGAARQTRDGQTTQYRAQGYTVIQVSWTPPANVEKQPITGTDAKGGASGPSLTDVEVKAKAAEQAKKAAAQKDKEARAQAETDDAVERWLDAALQAQTSSVPPVKTTALANKSSENKCRLVPDNRGYSTRSNAMASRTEALAEAKDRIPANCSATGQNFCDRVADMPSFNQQEFLTEFKKHMRNPKWKYVCDAHYTCADHQKEVCEGARTGSAAASRQ